MGTATIFTNSIINDHKITIINLFKTNEDYLGLLINYMEEKELMDHRIKETFISKLEKKGNCREKILYEIFDCTIRFITTFEFIEILQKFEIKHFHWLAKSIVENWNSIFASLKTYKKNEINKINLMKKNSKLFINKFYFPLIMKKINSLENNKLKDNSFFQELSSIDSSKILITGNSYIGKTMQMNRIIYLWSKSEILIENIILKFDCKKYNGKKEFYENLYQQNLPENSNIDRKLFEFFIFYDQNCTVILLIDNIEYLISKSGGDEIFLNILKINEKNFIKIIWSRKLQIFNYLNNFDQIYEIIGLDEEKIDDAIDKKKTDEKFINKLKVIKSYLNGDYGVEEKKLHRIPYYSLMTLLHDNISANVKSKFINELIFKSKPISQNYQCFDNEISFEFLKNLTNYSIEQLIQYDCLICDNLQEITPSLT